MKQLKENLKNGTLHQIYLLYGEERFLVDKYKQMIKDKLGFEGNGMNAHSFEGDSVSVGKIIDLAQTLPFFADKRIFLLENTGLFKSSGEELGEYLKEVPETAYFIFIEKDVDKRSKLYKAVKEKGYITQFASQDIKTLQQWVGTLLRNDKKKITAETAKYLIDTVGTDMGLLNLEIEKLVNYVGERDIIANEDIDTICIVKIGNHIFDLISEIANKNKDKAIILYYELLALKEPPLRILKLIVKQYQKLILLKSLQATNATEQAISDATEIPSYYIGKYAVQGRKYTSAGLRHCIELCVKAEEDVKTGKMKDTYALEVLIISLLYDVE